MNHNILNCCILDLHGVRPVIENKSVCAPASGKSAELLYPFQEVLGKSGGGFDFNRNQGSLLFDDQIHFISMRVPVKRQKGTSLNNSINHMKSSNPFFRAIASPLRTA